MLQFLTSDDAKGELAAYGGMAQTSVGVLLRKMVELEAQGAAQFFGEPEFDVKELLHTTSDGRGVVTCLEVADTQDKPLLYSTFLMWLLAELYHNLPEAGDLPKPKLVFFFDEAHLLFADASKAFLDQVQQVVRLIRSKGRRRLLHYPDPEGRAGRSAGAALEPGAARAPGAHAGRRGRAPGHRTDLSQNSVLRPGPDAHVARYR